MVSFQEYYLDECFRVFIRQTGNYSQFSGRDYASGGQKFLDSPIFVANNNADGGGPPFLLLGYFLAVPLMDEGGGLFNHSTDDNGVASIQRYADRMQANFDEHGDEQQGTFASPQRKGLMQIL